MSSSSDIQFITTPRDHIDMPCLQNMFDEMEAMINKRLEEHPNINEVEMRRRLAGKLCWNDLGQMNNYFVKAVPPAGKKSMTVWNKVVQEVSEATPDFNFSKDMGVVKRKYDEIRGNPEIISAYEENLERENSEREDLERENLERGDLEKTSFQQEAYKDAIKNLTETASNMLANFNSHIIIHIACDVPRQFEYPPLTSCNSNQSRAVNAKLEKVVGGHMVDAILNHLLTAKIQGRANPPVLDGNLKYVEARHKFRKIASEKWRSLGNQKKNIPWKSLFFDANYNAEIVDWPIEGELKLPFQSGEKVNFDSYKTKQLLELAKSFTEGKIYFRR